MRIKQLREKYGLKQIDLARKLNVSGQTILNWENNIHEPSIQQLKQLSELFNVSIDYLVENDKKNNGVNDLIMKLKEIEKDEFINFIKEKLEEK